jgi:hypothetical protein
MLALTLASACLGQDDARAAEIFARLATRYASREAWTGLAVSRRNLGDLKGAAEAVSRALATLVPDTTLTDVANMLARQLAAPGWCGLTVDGVLGVHVINSPHRIDLEIDGRPRGKLCAGTSALPSAWWRGAHKVGVIADGVHLLGSPLEAHAIRRIEGCVTACDGALDGWAWHPSDPAIDPVIAVSAASGEELTVIARDETGNVTRTTLLGRPRNFHLSANRLSGMAGPFHLRGSDGADLMGSPLDPAREQRAAAAAASALRTARRAAAGSRDCRGPTSGCARGHHRPVSAGRARSAPTSRRCGHPGLRRRCDGARLPSVGPCDRVGPEPNRGDRRCYAGS